MFQKRTVFWAVTPIVWGQHKNNSGHDYPLHQIQAHALIIRELRTVELYPGNMNRKDDFCHGNLSSPLSRTQETPPPCRFLLMCYPGGLASAHCLFRIYPWSSLAVLTTAYSHRLLLTVALSSLFPGHAYDFCCLLTSLSTQLALFRSQTWRFPLLPLVLSESPNRQ